MPLLHPPPPRPPPAVSTENWTAGQHDSAMSTPGVQGLICIPHVSPTPPLIVLPTGWGCAGKDLVSACPERQPDGGNCGHGPTSHATKQVLLLLKDEKSPSPGSSSASWSHGNKQISWKCVTLWVPWATSNGGHSHPASRRDHRSKYHSSRLPGRNWGTGS